MVRLEHLRDIQRVFASQFFHSESAGADLLKTLAVFAVGFLARPVGGFVFGWLADRKGRQVSMTLAVAVASLGSGLAHGGELPAAQTYLSEMAPRERRGLWSTFIYFSGTCGVIADTLLGAILATVLSHEQLTAFG